VSDHGYRVVVREVTEHTVYVNAPTKKEAARIALERRGAWGRDLRRRRVATVERDS
jgi:hypothetical protein